MVAIDGRAHIGGHVERVDNVLDAQWHAGKRTFRASPIERTRLIQRDIPIDKRPGLDLLVALFDTVKAVAHYRFRAEGAGCDALSDIAGGELVEASSCHYPLAALPAAVPAILPKTEPAVRPVPPG